jgi:hypothetical protein
MDNDPYGGVEFLVLASLILKSIGFLVRDELILRILVMTGILLDATFYALQPIPIVPPIISSLILAAINLGIIVIVIRERTTFSLTDRERRLFGVFSTLTPGQFRKLSKLARYETATDRIEILKEGVVPGHLYFIEGQPFEMKKANFNAVVNVPAFAGEVAYLSGKAASATVTLRPGTEYTVWSVEALRAVSGRNLALRNALVARFSLDLAQKVRDSVPLSAWDVSPVNGAAVSDT